MRLAVISTLNLREVCARVPQTAEKSKMRLTFILTVNLYATDDPPPLTRVFFREKCELYQPPQIALCFLRPNGSCVPRACKLL